MTAFGTWGHKKDYVRARGFLEKACNGGDHEGCKELAVLYQYGRRTQKDLAKARGCFYRRAARQGSARRPNLFLRAPALLARVPHWYSLPAHAHLGSCAGRRRIDCSGILLIPGAARHLAPASIFTFAGQPELSCIDFRKK